MKNPHKIKAGDIITTSGKGFLSALINVGTGGIPGYGASHVGIVGKYCGELYVFESTSVLPAGKRCAIRGDAGVKGVQASSIEEVISRPGKAWLHRLSRPLYHEEDSRMKVFVLNHLGTKYGTTGAALSGGVLWSVLYSIFGPESLEFQHCSEFVAECLSQIGVAHTSNSSAYNPNRLVRRLWARGDIKRKEQLK